MSDGVGIDPRLAWLGRASARLVLVEAGMIDLDDALDDHFVADLLDAIPTVCPCYSAQCRHFDRIRLELRQEQFRRWRANPAPRRERR